MSGINGTSGILGPAYQDMGQGVYYNLGTGRYETTNGNSSAVFNNGLDLGISTGNAVVADNPSNTISGLSELSSNLGTGIKNLVGTTYDELTKTRGTGNNQWSWVGVGGDLINGYLNYRLGKERLGIMKDQVANEKASTIYNATSAAGTALANAGTRLQMLSDFGNGAASKVLSNYTDLGNTLSAGIKSMGGDTTALNQQINGLNKYSALKS